MNNKRREFLKTGSLLTAAFLVGSQVKSFGRISKNTLGKRLQLNVIPVLYTGDMDCRVDPFHYGELSNIGGLRNIKSIIKDDGTGHILVDAGDFIDKKSSLDVHKNMIGLMNATGYAAATLGDKELSKGEAYLASLVPYMDFKLVNCNYEFSDPVLKDKIVPYYVVRHGEYKIGITGVGPDIRGKRSSEGITCHPPLKKANGIATYLKEILNCDMVICLSHLGMEQKKGQQGNKKFAAASKNIDAIISGHNKAITHPQLIMRNSQESQVIIGNAGYGGSILGRLNYTFNNDRKMQLFACKNFVPGTPEPSFHEGYRKLRG